MEKQRDRKYGRLLLGIVLDMIGMFTSSWVVPILGDFVDVVWAPLAGFAMLRMYKGRVGQVAGSITLIEEALPGWDIIPSFTLTWLYVYVIKRKPVINKESTIEKL